LSLHHQRAQRAVALRWNATHAQILQAVQGQVKRSFSAEKEREFK